MYEPLQLITSALYKNSHTAQVPQVQGLDAYIQRFPNRITHSKFYRSPTHYPNKRVLVIGNSASGHDITTQLAQSGSVALPVYQSRRSRGRWDGSSPQPGVEWKPIISSYDAESGRVHFCDGSVLQNIDTVIYCTGYKPSFPFWNSKANGGPLYDYADNKLVAFYQHTFSTQFPRSLGIIGLPRVLTFRSFEYQGIALARLFCGREARPLPSTEEMRTWDRARKEKCEEEGRQFHTILWDDGETMEWFRYLYELAGLPLLEGKGRAPPVLGERERWAYDNIKKYPEPGKGGRKYDMNEAGWDVIEEKEKDSAWFI